MTRLIIFLIAVSVLVACGAKEKPVKATDSIQTDHVTEIYKNPDADKCNFLGLIKESGFDFKEAKEFIFINAMKKGATHVRLHKVTSAYSATAHKDKNGGAAGGEIFLLKAKVYQCADENE